MMAGLGMIPNRQMNDWASVQDAFAQLFYLTFCPVRVECTSAIALADRRIHWQSPPPGRFAVASSGAGGRLFPEQPDMQGALLSRTELAISKTHQHRRKTSGSRSLILVLAGTDSIALAGGSQ
jgi:hypothetical protein